MIRVKVQKQLLVQLGRAIEGTDEALASAVAEAAFFHATKVLGSLPDAVKGKLAVEMSEVDSGDGNSATITYSPKGGVEASTIQMPKGGSKAIFLPLDRLGGFSTRAPSFSSGGEEGVWVASVGLTGRPSIEGYLMSRARAAVAESEEITLDFAVQKAKEELKEWFRANGIVFNPSAGSTGRYQATQGVELPWGTSVPGGRFIVGEF